MLISEIVQKLKKPRKPASLKTDFEKNAAHLRSKERKLDAKSSVPAIKHSD